jgi:hypothetical protein
MYNPDRRGPFLFDRESERLSLDHEVVLLRGMRVIEQDTELD